LNNSSVNSLWSYNVSQRYLTASVIKDKAGK